MTVSYRSLLHPCYIVGTQQHLWSVGLADGGGCPDLLAGRAHAEIQLQVPLQDPAHHGGGGVPLGQPGAAQQALQHGLQLQQQLVHGQATGSPHGAVQGSHGVGRGAGVQAGGGGRLLPLQALCGRPVARG